MESSLHAFEYCVAREKLESFFWKDYCDNYLEIVKVRSYGERSSDSTANSQKSSVYTLYCTLNIIIKLFAPYFPFITEEIHNLIYTDQKSIHYNSWPKFNQSFSSNLDTALLDTNVNLDLSPKARQEVSSVEIALNILNCIRKYKTDIQQSIKTPIEFVYVYIKKQVPIGNLLLEDLVNVTNIDNIECSFIDTNKYCGDNYDITDNIDLKLYIKKL